MKQNTGQVRPGAAGLGAGSGRGAPELGMTVLAAEARAVENEPMSATSRSIGYTVFWQVQALHLGPRPVTVPGETPISGLTGAHPSSLHTAQPRSPTFGALELGSWLTTTFGFLREGGGEMLIGGGP